ncbi:MAG: phosphoglucomutase/phosphomannomutase family protein [Haloferacaceae archaeon]
MDEGRVDVGPVSFGTDGWRAPLATFTEPRVRAVGRAVAAYLDEEAGAGGEVLVGYDARETSEGFAAALGEELAAAGFDAVLPERDRPTPVVAWNVVERGAAGALVVTASHNPPEYNGVKFIPADGAPALPEVTDAIEGRLAAAARGVRRSGDGDGGGAGSGRPAGGRGSVGRANLLDPYLDAAAATAGSYGDGDAGGDPSGLRVAYDAMHGSGRGVTDELLARAGAEVERLRCDRDPAFGGGAPEPSAEHLGDLAAAVREGDAALGIANDGDADRVALVTPERGVLDGNRTYALLYDFLLESAAGPAVRTVSTTFLIDRIAAAAGTETVETPVGFKWVAAAMAENDALVGGEESGGYTVRGHVREKDGVLVGLLAALAAASEPLDDRLDRIAATHGSVATGKVSLDCPDDAKAAVVEGLSGAIPETVAGEEVADVVTKDGFKLLRADGSWLLVRPSGTEPKMRVYAEAETDERVAALLDAGRELVAPLIPS